MLVTVAAPTFAITRLLVWDFGILEMRYHAGMTIKIKPKAQTMSGILGDLQLCIDAGLFLYNASQEMKANEEDLARLFRRGRIFESALKAYQTNPGLLTETVVSSVIELKSTMLDIQAYQEANKRTTLKNNALTRFAFRKGRAEDIGAFNARLSACAQNLTMVQGIDAAQRRGEDLEDLKSSFEFSVAAVLEEVAAQQELGKATVDAVVQVKADIAEYHAHITELMAAMNHGGPLTGAESTGVAKVMDKLARQAEERHQEIMAKLAVIEGKVGAVHSEVRAMHKDVGGVRSDVGDVKDIVLQIAQSMAALTPDQEHIRANALAELRVAPSSITDVDINSLINEGGFGVVYEGRYLGRQVAVKIISLASNGAAKQREAENEILMMKQLSSPLTLHCYGYSLANKQMKIILDFACHKSLDMVLENKAVPAFPATLQVAWMQDSIGALKFIHSKGIKHRDVKPGNLLVYHEFHTKLSDFGSSKAHVSLHSVGGVIGTVAFMAPEVRGGQPSDYAADVYSWAATAINILSRYMSTVGLDGSISDRCLALNRLAVDTVEGLALEIGKQELIKLLLDCLKYDPHMPAKDFRPSASEVARRLAEILAANGGDPRSMKTKPQKQMIKALEKLLVPPDSDSEIDDMLTPQPSLSPVTAVRASDLAVSNANLPATPTEVDILSPPSPEPTFDYMGSADCETTVALSYIADSLPFADSSSPADAVELTAVDVVAPVQMTIAQAFQTLPASNNPALAEQCLNVIINGTDNLVLSSDQSAVVVETIRSLTPHQTSDPTGILALACKVVGRLANIQGNNRASIVAAGGIDVALSVLRTRKDDKEVAEQGIFSLHKLFFKDDKQIIAVALAGGIETILSGMRAHPNVAGVAEIGCSALGYLAYNAENKMAVAKAGGIEVIISAMMAHRVVAGVAQQGLFALKNLASNVENKVAIAKAGGIELILSAIRAHPSVAVVAEMGCGALGSLAGRNAENKAAISKAGGIEAILSSMRAHASVAGVAEAGCGAFKNLAFKHAANQVAITKAGGIEAILSAMKTHAGADGVAQQGCAALGNLTLNAEPIRVAIVKGGGIEIVLSAMRAHSAVGGVADQGCGALGNLALSAENRVAIAKAGGIETIISAMMNHPCVAGVADQGCGALGNLALSVDNRVLIVRTGGIDVILSAMRAHSSVVVVADHGCGALGNLALNTENKAVIANAGGIEVILSAMRALPDVAGVADQGCCVLGNLAFSAANQVAIAEAGGIDAILAAMRAHPTVTGVADQGCFALQHLAVNADNKVVIARAGGIELILSAMGAHGKDAGVAEMGCGALGNLAANNSANQVAIAKGGGINAILSAMRFAKVVQQGCCALGHLSLIPENQVTIANAGGIEALLSVMKTFSSVAGVVEHGCIALRNLSSNAENRALIKRGGGKDVIKEVVRLHSSNANVMDNCNIVLKALPWF